MDKSPDAFRTISEVSDYLETPAHVFRFWESRFPQIRPVKRAGGRRYYRPADVALLGGIKKLLHDEGLTIRGVQKMLREQGVRHVAGLGGAEVDEAALEAEVAQVIPLVPRKAEVVEVGTGAGDISWPSETGEPPAPEEPAQASLLLETKSMPMQAPLAEAYAPPVAAALSAPMDRIAALQGIHARLVDLRNRMAEANRRVTR
jgi:DNA-binding transcriptional MerR regulator